MPFYIMEKFQGYVATPFGCSLQLSCPSGNVLQYQQVNTWSYPPGVKLWSRGTEGWYYRIATLDGPMAETGHVTCYTILAKASWDTYGNAYVGPSKQFKADLAAAIAAIPADILLQREEDARRAPALQRAYAKLLVDQLFNKS